MTMNEERRQQILDKWGPVMAAPPDPSNAHAVVAVDDGPHIVAECFNWPLGSDVNELFDPARCPETYAVARRALAELRAQMAAGTVEYVDASDRPYNPDDVDEAAMLVNFVGSPGILVVRADAVDMFAAMYKATWQVSVRRAALARCQVRIADVCAAACANGRTLEFWPYECGQFMLMFPICGTCRAKAIRIAEDGMKCSVIAAHERLAEQPDPTWARMAPWYLRIWAAVRRAFRRAR